MARAFYSQYVNHCLRFYARYQKPKFYNEVDKRNWIVCKDVLEDFSEQDRELLLTIYRNRDTVEDNVYQMSKDKGISQDTIWKLINELEYKIAKRRGLL